MPLSLVTAVQTSVKRFAGVENQQKWRKKYKTQDNEGSNSKWKVFLT